MEKTILLTLETPINDERKVHLIGNFNEWNSEKAVTMKRQESGQYSISIPPYVKLPIEYKFIKDNLNGIEIDEYGNDAEKRIISNRDNDVINKVLRWKEDGLTYKKEYLPTIKVISDNFEIPQLIKTRRIAALLPHDYHETDKKYPVLYLQDGQNLFDDYAPYGNWSLDEKLAIMAERGSNNFIVIAIDHGRDKRIEEYTPSHQTKIGMGDGKKYARFLADTLKPYVDGHFRTKPERENTGIGGSSMGGLISLYAGLLYPEVYSKLLIFSPSLWVAPNLLSKTPNFVAGKYMKIYLYAGEEEGPNVVESTIQLKEKLSSLFQNKTLLESFLSIHPNGKHSEHFWGQEFIKAAEWLY